MHCPCEHLTAFTGANVLVGTTGLLTPSQPGLAAANLHPPAGMVYCAVVTGSQAAVVIVITTPGTLPCRSTAFTACNPSCVRPHLDAACPSLQARC